MSTDKPSREPQKFENYTIKEDNEISVNAALIILLPGFILLWITVSSYSDALFSPSVVLNFTNDAIDGFFIIFELVGISLFYTQTGLILPSMLGWFFGGLIAAVIYGKEGSSSPLKSGWLVFKIFAPIALFVLASRAMSLNLSFNQNNIINNIAISTLTIISLALPLLALPVLIASSIGYKIGLVFSD